MCCQLLRFYATVLWTNKDDDDDNIITTPLFHYKLQTAKQALALKISNADNKIKCRSFSLAKCRSGKIAQYDKKNLAGSRSRVCRISCSPNLALRVSLSLLEVYITAVKTAVFPDYLSFFAKPFTPNQQRSSTEENIIISTCIKIRI